MKKYSILLLITMVVSLCQSFVVMSYDKTNDYAVLLNNNFYAYNSMKIVGDVYTANGDVKFGSSNQNTVNGDIFLNESKQYTYVDKPKLKGTVQKLAMTTFGQESIDFADFPTISNYISSFIADWKSTPGNVTQSTHYGVLTINSALNVDVSKGDIVIVADKFNINDSGELKLIGNGKLYLYINDNFAMSSSSKINNGGISDNVNIIVNGTFGYSGSAVANANFYVANNVNINGGSFIKGNIVANGTSFIMQGAVKINGVVYAPLAKVQISSSAVINGRLVADSLDIFNGGEIGYANTTLSIPTNLIKPTPTPTPTPTPSPADTVYVPSGDPVYLEYAYAYLYGYGGMNEVGANDKIKRSEACSLIYRLLKQNNKIGDFTKPATASFSDLQTSDWFYTAVEYMTKIGVYKKNDDLVKPFDNITRGEAAKIVAISLNIAPNNSIPNSVEVFTDLTKDNLNYYYIKGLYDAGVINGVSSTQMNPDGDITRPEVIAIINRLMGRGNAYDIEGVTVPYTDISPTDWFYEDILRASYGFSDTPDSTGKYKVDPTRKYPRETLDYN